MNKGTGIMIIDGGHHLGPNGEWCTPLGALLDPFLSSTPKPKTAEEHAAEAKKLAEKEAKEVEAKAKDEKRRELDKACFKKCVASDEAARATASSHTNVVLAVQAAKDARKFVVATEGFNADSIGFDGKYMSMYVTADYANTDAIRELNGDTPRSEVLKEIGAAKDAFAQVIRKAAIEYATSLEAIAAKHLAAK